MRRAVTYRKRGSVNVNYDPPATQKTVITRDIQYSSEKGLVHLLAVIAGGILIIVSILLEDRTPTDGKEYQLRRTLIFGSSCFK
jgi:hypothetical protein